MIIQWELYERILLSLFVLSIVGIVFTYLRLKPTFRVRELGPHGHMAVTLILGIESHDFSTAGVNPFSCIL